MYYRIDQLYADEKIKPEKLEEYTKGLVGELRKTSLIEAFTATGLHAFMPKYNELKHFNPAKIVAAWQRAVTEKQKADKEAASRGPLNLTFNI